MVGIVVISVALWILITTSEIQQITGDLVRLQLVVHLITYTSLICSSGIQLYVLQCCLYFNQVEVSVNMMVEYINILDPLCYQLTVFFGLCGVVRKIALLVVAVSCNEV